MTRDMSFGGRRSHSPLRGAAPLVLVMALGVTGVAFAKRDLTPRLAGHWQLDIEHSETLQHGLRDAGPDRFMGDTLPGFGADLGAPHKQHLQPKLMPPGEHPEITDPMARDPALAAIAHPPLTMQIDVGDHLVVFRARGKTIKTLRLPSAPASRVPEGDVLEAEWLGHKLEAHGSGPHRGRLIETYVLGKEDSTLVIKTRVVDADGLPNFDVERLYRRVNGD